MDFETDLRINKFRLDEEWLAQPGLFMRYAQKQAEASKELDAEKHSLEVTKAQVDRAIRMDPEEYNIDGKVTERQVEAVVLQDSDYQSAMEIYNDAKYNLGLLTSAVRAFDQRKSALENLVRLHGQSYFAEPRSPKGGEDIGDDAREQASHEVVRRRRRRST